MQYDGTRDIAAILGLRPLPPDAGGDYLRRARWRRRARDTAHRRREVGVLPGACAYERRHRGSRDPARGADERPGREPRGTGHTGAVRAFRNGPQGDRHGAQQRRVRRLQVPLCVARAPVHEPFPLLSGGDEGLLHSRRRGALHLAVGLRLPP